MFTLAFDSITKARVLVHVNGFLCGSESKAKICGSLERQPRGKQQLRVCVCMRTSWRVGPHAFHIFITLVRLSSICSTRRQRSVIAYWPTVSAYTSASTSSASMPSLRSNTSISWPHVVWPVMPDIQRCSRFTQIGISSSDSADCCDDRSLSSSSDDDDTDTDASDMRDELVDDDEDNEHSAVPLSRACSIFCVR